MSGIKTIALNTFRESIRGKVLYVVLVFGGILILSTYFLSPLSVGSAREKIITDVGLAFISFIGVMTVVVVGSTLVHKEIDKKAVYMVLIRPITRLEYILGKFFGIMTAVLLIALVMGVLTALSVLLGGGNISGQLVAAVYFSILEMAVMCSIVLFFSTFTTPVLTFFFAACVFAAGSLSGDLRVFAEKMGSSGGKLIMDLFYYILPNLSIFNYRHEAVHQLPVPINDLLISSVYSLVYCGALLLLAYLVFRRREFT
ncbi:MAG: ABC transporter permease subunit [Candidatus Latescibacteria bacterium]|nr:ABC transporter permease subunit [bacterium]MBD3424945.1 ABC transporter permease subunit [Candidatus Latescibacterota bacterium]